MQASIQEFQGDSFYVQQLFTGCLAEMAYYIESDGQAVIIDPLRDHECYIQIAETRQSKITHILETHFHADFVSGHFDLAKKTGAKIVFGPTASSKQAIYVAKDNEEIVIGKIQLRVLHTPGHTPESSCFLLIKPDGKPHSIFTGDTLFLGDVGRPDLAVSGAISKEDLAAWLYDSLRNRIMPLPEDVIVFPGHGAGSACGQNIQTGTHSTMAEQMKSNYALQQMDQEEFIKVVTAGIPTPPQYFFHDASVNRNGYEPLWAIKAKGKTALSLEKFLQLAQEDMIIIDTRVPYEFLTGYIKGSYNVNLVMNFASWVGLLINAKSNIILICAVGKEDQSIIRLARIGFDYLHGYLEGGIQTYQQSGLELNQNQIIGAEDFISTVLPSKPFVLDVRAPQQYQAQHMVGAQNLPLNTMEEDLKQNPKLLPTDRDIYLKCQSGGRASTSTSILAKYGFTNIINIKDGLDALKTHGVLTVKKDH